MSLPLRHPLEDATSLDRVLEDLIVRFIINCPPEDFSSVERELFHVEEASWFYTDFVILMNPNLPNMRIKSFAQNVIKLCPLVWKWDVKADQALKKFSQYKKSIPVRGAAIFNKSLTKILLVKGTESDSWSFPRGKISKDEDDVDCCIREVQEEIGYDITDHIDEDQFIERNIQGKNYKIFLVSGVPEDFDFKPKVRNEIEKIEWRDFRKLSRSIHKPNVKYYLVNAMIRPMAVWIKSRKGVKDDDQLKSHVEEQLKLLLGIKKDDTADPGRELLNMLQGAATSSKPEQVEQAVQDGSPSQVQQPLQQPPISGVPFMVPPPQFQQQFPFMGFQPFAPFPFNNGVGVPPGVAPLPPSSPGVQIQAPPTPSLNVLAKPTVAEEAEKGGAAPSKVLLDLLNENDDQREQTRPKIKLLKRGEMLEDQQKPANFVNNSSYIQQDPNANGNSTDANALLTLLKRPIKTAQTEGSALLKMIQKPAESTANPKEEHYNSSSGLETSSLEQSNTNESEYEDFESCSSMGDEEDEEFEEDEEDEEDLAEEMSKEVEENEEEKLEKLEQKEKSSGNESQEALKQNFFVPGSVPHVDPHNMSDLSTGGAVDLKSLKSQAKPKIKILKRGETLKDIAFESRNASESSTNGPEPMHSHQQDSKDLLNMLKKTQMIAMEEVRQSLEKSRMLNSPELLPRPNSALTESKHQTESVGPPVRSTDTFAEAHNTDKSMISPESSDPFTSDSADLLSLLKKPTRTHQSPLAGQTPIVGSVDQFVSDRDHDSKELLKLLKKTETSSTPGYNEAEKVATTPTETTYPENNVSTAHELLNVLKNGSIPTMPAKTSIYKEESRGPVTGSSDLSSSYSTPVVVSSPLHEQMRMPATNGMNMEPYQTPSQNLLQMLKHPRPAEQYDYTMNAPFHNGIPRDQPQVNNQSSNELLALLQKK